MNTFLKRVEHLISQVKPDDLIVVFTDRAGQQARLPFPEWKVEWYHLSRVGKLTKL